MSQLALSLVQQACYSSNIPAPSALVGATDASTLQLLQLFYDTGRELRQARWWPQLKRRFAVPLVQGRTQYQLPQDFYSALPGTHWDQQNRWEMRGPLTDASYNYRTYGYVTVENRKAYRIFGPDINTASDRGQFWVNPTPGPNAGGNDVTFEYISKSWIIPPAWAASAVLTGTIYRNADGNNYLLTGNGTTSATPPSMAYGQGQDGGVFWTYLTVAAWGTATAYAQGDYVTNGGSTYVCSQSGISSGGPSGTTTGEADGTAKWDYLTINAWTAETSYSVGDYVSKSGNKYKCTTPRAFSSAAQLSGKIGPRWTATTETDNTATWTFQPQAFDTLITDSDLCLFDEELMILGLKWRFMQASRMEYQDIKEEYESLKARAASRWTSGEKISLGSGGMTRSINVPEGNYGL